LNQGLVNSPTPGSPSPATLEGTANNATPNAVSWLPFSSSPVISYDFTNSDGGGAVVNVTQPGHPLHPGYVSRYTSVNDAGSTIVNNTGEGTGWLQSSSSPFANTINGVWPGQTQGIIDSINSPQSYNFGNGGANGGFVLYPNKINNNISISVYAK